MEPSTEPTTFFWGRQWDAPLTDDAVELRPEAAGLILPTPCGLCQEPMQVTENLMLMPHLGAHTECLVRSGVGDVPHLERRCLCFGGSDHDDRSYREGSLAAIQWLIDHDQGRFHDHRSP